MDGKTSAETNHDVWRQSSIERTSRSRDQSDQEETQIDGKNSQNTYPRVAYSAAAHWRGASTATAETTGFENPPNGELQPGSVGEDQGVAQEVYPRDGKPILYCQSEGAEPNDEPRLGSAGQGG